MMEDQHRHQTRPDRPELPGWVSDPENALRLRLYVDNRLRSEVWIDAADPNADSIMGFAMRLHTAMSDLAQEAGLSWMTEVYDPAALPDEAYLRIGTDRAAMIDPVPLDGLLPGIDRLFGGLDGWPGRMAP